MRFLASLNILLFIVIKLGSILVAQINCLLIESGLIMLPDFNKGAGHSQIINIGTMNYTRSIEKVLVSVVCRRLKMRLKKESVNSEFW
jgi:hypothetical protein